MTSQTEPASSGLTHKQILVIFSGLMLGMLLAALDQTIVSTALPTIVGDLHGLDHISWVVTAYLLTSTASAPLYGKLSDLYGRRPIFQAAISIFLIGSILSGISQTMGQLIAFRAVQGLGAGGLMTLALIIVGDVVSPRERGRYQGYFGGVFAISSVGGPLLGGFFVDNLSWRWVFYINIPLGLLALVVTSIVLRLPFTRRDHAVDYVGAGLMVSGVTALLLVTVWGGSQYAWGSGTIIGLAVVGLALSAAFIWWEHRVAEPILPPYLFGLGVFRVSTSVIFVVGFALFGTIIYLSVYLQIFHDVSPTKSGLLLTPLMGGILLASVFSGRMVSKSGKIKLFPVLGTALLTVGMTLLAQLGANTSLVLAAIYMLITGAGVGMVMQNLTLAVQNAVPRTEMGAATSSVAFFRSLGGSFGTAVFGAILFSRLDANLASRLPVEGRPKGDLHQLIQSPTVIRHLPSAIRTPVVSSFIDAMHVVFYAGAAVCALAFLISLFLKESTLRTTSAMSPGNSEPGAEPAMSSGMMD
ncbi:MAG: hypothetical protein QOE64_304 [Frankiales bacterium]|jgi:EmrB/QacA subfamily drug resistance transporter|nr:hypothetical protein [Frankiales bacterium]